MPLVCSKFVLRVHFRFVSAHTFDPNTLRYEERNILALRLVQHKKRKSYIADCENWDICIFLRDMLSSAYYCYSTFNRNICLKILFKIFFSVKFVRFLKHVTITLILTFIAAAYPWYIKVYQAYPFFFSFYSTQQNVFGFVPAFAE